MYGKKSATDEWTPGVFSKLWEMYIHKNKSSKNWWILCDGPVDTLWIESLNTVLDDNRILTLASGDRLPMSENLKLVFEVENLNNASPATVSRCGIVYVDPLDLGYPCLIQTFIQKRKHNSVKDADVLSTLMNKYLIEGKLIEQIQEFAKKPKMELNHIGIATNILRLLNGLLISKANPQQENIILGDGSDSSA
jgi:dynein heavy chain